MIRAADREWWAEHEAIHGADDADDDVETSRDEQG